MKHKALAIFCAAALLSGQMLYLPSPIVPELTVSANLEEEGMGQIGADVFWQYSNGTLTIYGNGAIDEISYYPWTNMDSIQYPDFTTIIIENGVTNLPEGIFQGLATVSEVEIADTVTSIGANAFAGCSNIQQIELPDALTTLSGTAFDGTEIGTLYLPPALAEISDNYFEGMTSLCYISGETTGYAADGPGLYNADYTKLLRYIPTTISDVSIREGVTEIGTAVFANHAIHSVSFPASLTIIGERAFSGCNLQSVTFHGTQTQWNLVQILSGNEILDAVTMNFTGIENVPDYLDQGTVGKLPWTLTQEGVLTIYPDTNTGSGAIVDYRIMGLYSDEDYTEVSWNNEEPPWFKHQSVITSIIIREGIHTVGNAAFVGLPFVTSVSIPASVISIGTDAFSYSRRLETVNFAENSSLLAIGEDAFQYCLSLKYFTIPESVTTLGANCFDNIGAETIHIPASVTEIGECAFIDCMNLKSITVAKENPAYTSQDGVLYNRGKSILLLYPPQLDTEIVFLPPSVTAIAPRAFAWNDHIRNVWLHDGITAILDDAFYYCNQLSYIRLPSTLTYMGYSIFYHCNSLSSLALPASLTECQSLSSSMYVTDHVWFEGTAEQFAAIEGYPEEDALEYGVTFNALPSAYLACDTNHDHKVDATEAAQLLRYAAAEGSGYTGGYAYFLMSNKKQANYRCISDIDTGAVPADVNADGNADASDAAMMLQYAAAVGAGYGYGFPTFLKK